MLISVMMMMIMMILMPASLWGEPSAAPYAVGERLDFKIYFEFILGGEANMSIKSIEEVEGKTCFQLVSEARSTPTVDLMYKVRDRIEAWCDTSGGQSRRYVKRLREGRWKDDKVVTYQPADSLALLQRKASHPPETLSVKPGVVDILTAFYEVRRRELIPGQSVLIAVHDIDKTYDLEVRVLGRERIDAPAGTFDCLVVEPLLQSSGIFRREGSLQVWLTDDEYRMPVLMKSRLYFGSVWARLVGYRRGN
ncbi:MAG: DUF3108 domain-containing protein [Calditrichaeota bacterium]|nr:DUF3108 domain-containing protein [Calditrichota bacterium]